MVLQDAVNTVSCRQTVLRNRALALFILFTPVLAACSSADKASVADGLGHASIAIYSASPYPSDGRPSGHITLIEENGEIRQVELHGAVYFGSLDIAGGEVVGAESNGEVAIGRSAITRVDRGVTYDMQEWATAVGPARWTFFNVGTGRSAKYETGISVFASGRSVVGSVLGEPLGFTKCAGRVYAAMGDWAKPDNRRGTTIKRFSTTEADIAARTVAKLRLPVGTHVTNLVCWRGSLVVMASGAGRVLYSVAGEGTGQQQSWQTIQNRMGAPRLDGDEGVLGELGQDVYFFFPREGVRALNMRSGRVRQVLTFTENQVNSVVGMQNGKLVALVQDFDAASTVRTYDPRNGRMLREYDASALDTFLESTNEEVIKPPLLISDKP